MRSVDMMLLGPKHIIIKQVPPTQGSVIHIASCTVFAYIVTGENSFLTPCAYTCCMIQFLVNELSKSTYLPTSHLHSSVRLSVRRSVRSSPLLRRPAHPTPAPDRHKRLGLAHLRSILIISKRTGRRTVCLLRLEGLRLSGGACIVARISRFDI